MQSSTACLHFHEGGLESRGPEFHATDTAMSVGGQQVAEWGERVWCEHSRAPVMQNGGAPTLVVAAVSPSRGAGNDERRMEGK